MLMSDKIKHKRKMSGKRMETGLKPVVLKIVTNLAGA